MPERTPNSNRTRLIRAAIDLLLEDGLDLLPAGLAANKIADRAGVSENTLTNIFKENGKYTGEQKKHFDQEVIRNLGVDPTGSQYQLGQIQEKIAESRGDPRETIRMVSERNLELLTEDPGFRERLILESLGFRHPHAYKALREDYRQLMREAEEVYRSIIDQWGATLRRPFSVPTVAATICAIVEGFALRKLVDPGAVPQHLVGNVVIAFAASVVDLKQVDEHIDQVAEPIARRAMLDYRVVKDGHPEDPEQAVIDAARDEFKKHGYYGADIARIEAAANVVSRERIALFASKAHIIVAALKPSIEGLQRRLDNDQTLQLDGVDVITRHLTRLAKLCLGEIAYFEAFLMVVAHETWTDSDTTISPKEVLDLPAILEPVIRNGQEQGAFTDHETSRDMAATITNALMLQCFTRRNESAEKIVSTISHLFLDGIKKDMKNPAK